MRDQLGERLPRFSEPEFALLREAQVDFYGMNYYTAQYSRHRTQSASVNDFIGNVDELQENKEGVSIGEESGVHWLHSSPDSFRKHLARIYHRYRKPIYITENGCPCPGEDKMARDESVKDTYRLRYLEEHINAISQAITQDSAVVSGYFAWSLLDNLGKSGPTRPLATFLEPKLKSLQNGLMDMGFALELHTQTTTRLNGRRKCLLWLSRGCSRAG
jgi:beta-glucosidase